MKSPKNIFTDKEQFRTIDTIRIVYFAIFVLTFIFTEFGRYVYRPFIYHNHINDFGIADSIGNWGGIVVQIFFGLAIINSSFKQGFSVIAVATGGYILYEFAQPYLPKGTFDWLDVYGTLAGGIIALALFFLIHKSIKHNKVIYRFN